MTIPPDIVRVRMAFDLKQGTTSVDQAIMGFHLGRNHNGGNTTNWPADCQEIANKVWQKWVSNVTSPSAWSGQVALGRVDAYHLDTNGRSLDKASAFVGGPNPAWQGSSGNASLPFETACAISLYAYDVGAVGADLKHKRGRFYLPPFSSSVMGNGVQEGMYDHSYLDTLVANKVTAFLNDVHHMTVGGGVTPDSVSLVVLSRASSQANRVVRARAGHRPDRQSRRGRKLPETYTDFPITNS